MLVKINYGDEHENVICAFNHSGGYVEVKEDKVLTVLWTVLQTVFVFGSSSVEIDCHSDNVSEVESCSDYVLKYLWNSDVFNGIIEFLF